MDANAKLVLQEVVSKALVSLIVETRKTRRLGRVGDSLLSGGDIAAGAADGLVALKVALAGVLRKASVDSLALSARLETVKTGARVLVVRLAVVVQLGRGLTLAGVTKTGVNLLGSGTADGLTGSGAALDWRSLSDVVWLEGAEIKSVLNRSMID